MPNAAPHLVKPPPVKWSAGEEPAFSTRSLAQPAVWSAKVYQVPTRCSTGRRKRSPSSKSSNVGAVPAAASEHSSTRGGGSLVTGGQLGSELVSAEPAAIRADGRSALQPLSKTVAAP